MTRRLDELAAEALELERESRAALARTLLDSLDEPSVDAVGEEWLAEAERRYREIKEGKVRTIPSDVVFAEIEARHGR